MRTAACLLVLSSAAALLGLCTPEGAEQCPSYDVLEEIVYLPHPDDCSSFRRCQSGKPILGHCPPAQHFNPTTASCGDPAQSGCEVAVNGTASCPEETPKSTCQYQCACSRKDDASTCPAKMAFSLQLQVFDGADDPTCPKVAGDFNLIGEEVGRIVVANSSGNASSCPDHVDGNTVVAHFADCSKAVTCANGTEQARDCPPGLLYNPELGFCDVPEYVNCSSVPDEASSGGGGCSLLTSCVQMCKCRLVQGSCPSSISYSTKVDFFKKDKGATCSQEEGVIDLGGGLVGKMTVVPNTTQASRCPSNSSAGRVYLPDPKDCGRAILCFKGTERFLSCPAGLHFNPRTKMCGHPDPANPCGGGDPQTTTPPPVTTPTPATSANDTVALDNEPCPTTWACPSGKNSSVPHLSDCTMFCICGTGGPFLAACPPGLHFSLRAKDCQAPAKANCHSTCPQISMNERGTWAPEECIDQDSQEGVVCRLTCDSKYQLMGSESINCTNRGWYGSSGLNHIPSCNTPEEFGETVNQKLNETLEDLGKQKAGIIFILDESLSVDPAFFLDARSTNFQAQKNLAASIVRGFPLSDNRTAGLVTFSTDASADIAMKQTSTCDFVSQLGNVTFFGGNTDLAVALLLAAAEINRTSPPRKTLVLIVTDGQSQSDPGPAAQMLKDAGHVVFTIALADYDRQQLEPISSTHTDGSKLFFALPNFELFRTIEYYLSAKYNQSAPLSCP